jgi:hypothetical protein
MSLINYHNVMPHTMQRIGRGGVIGIVDGMRLVIDRFEYIKKSKFNGLEMLVYGSLDGKPKCGHTIAMFVLDGMYRQWEIIGVGVLTCWIDSSGQAHFEVGGREFVNIVRRSDLLKLLAEVKGE